MHYSSFCAILTNVRLSVLGPHGSLPDSVYEPKANLNAAERALQDAEADVLMILDCCSAGIITKGGVESAELSRTYESLVATGPNMTTARPGPLSYTRALIDSLNKLRQEGRPFSTFDLHQSIMMRRKNMISQFFNLSPSKRNRHIILAPLAHERGRENDFPRTFDSWSAGYLDVRFHFGKAMEFRDDQIQELARQLSGTVKSTDLPISDIEWISSSSRPPGERFASLVRLCILIRKARRLLARRRWSIRYPDATDAVGVSHSTAGATIGQRSPPGQTYEVHGRLLQVFDEPQAILVRKFLDHWKDIVVKRRQARILLRVFRRWRNIAFARRQVSIARKFFLRWRDNIADIRRRRRHTLDWNPMDLEWSSEPLSPEAQSGSAIRAGGTENRQILNSLLTPPPSTWSSPVDVNPTYNERNGSLGAPYRRLDNAEHRRDYILDLAYPERTPSNDTDSRRAQKHSATLHCHLCPKRFTRAYNFRSHLRTHTDERPFVCTVCGKAYARQLDRKRHEGLHSGEKKFVCRGTLQGKSDQQWGCGRRFARADALGRHFRSEAGCVCLQPLLDEEAIKKMDTTANFLPAALLQQHPALACIDWDAVPRELDGVVDEGYYSGRSSTVLSEYSVPDFEQSGGPSDIEMAEVVTCSDEQVSQPVQVAGRILARATAREDDPMEHSAPSGVGTTSDSNSSKSLAPHTELDHASMQCRSRSADTRKEARLPTVLGIDIKPRSQSQPAIRRLSHWVCDFSSRIRTPDRDTISQIIVDEVCFHVSAAGDQSSSNCNSKRKAGSQPPNSGGKRRLITNQYGSTGKNTDDDDCGDGGVPQRGRKPTKFDLVDEREWACYYSKRDPTMYNGRIDAKFHTCGSKGWRNSRDLE